MWTGRSWALWMALAACRYEDVVEPDATIPDAGLRDAVVPDAVIADAEIPDAEIPDAIIPDAIDPALCPPVGPETFALHIVDEDIDELSDVERAAREAYAATPIALEGTLVDEAGTPIPDAHVTLGDLTACTLSDGHFGFVGLARHNRVLEVRSEGRRVEYLHAYLAQPVEVERVVLPALTLIAERDDEVRFLFAGDVSLGRRYLDVDASTPRDSVPPDDPDALILASDPMPGSIAVMRYMRHLFQASDFPIVNLETVVTTDPATPHPTKDFVFFTFPDSLAALRDLGVTYVSQGNNHVYDYQARGLDDTIMHLDAWNIDHSGAGATPDEAFAPHRETLKGTPYSFVAMCSIAGDEHAVHYVADDVQGGAADLRDDARITSTITGEIAEGRTVIAMLHSGEEYSFEPASYAYDRDVFAAELGADLVVAHHPHTPQGFSYESGVLAMHSLGNFAFDSLRHDTFWSMVVRADMQGGDLVRVEGLPIDIEDYVPKPLIGPSRDRFARRIADFSNRYGAHVIGYGEGIRVSPTGDEYVHEDRTETLTVHVGDEGYAIADLRGVAPADASLLRVASTGSPRIRMGRDLLQFGDFEDTDVDDDTLELARWDLGGRYSYPCLHDRVRGTASLCLYGRASQPAASVAALRNRVRVMGDSSETPNKDLTMFGYSRADNGGAVYLRAEYGASEGEAMFGMETAYSVDAGTRPWAPFHHDLHMPDDVVPVGPMVNPRSLRLFIVGLGPNDGSGVTMFDELAIISWEEDVGPADLATPHARDFLRIEAPEGDYTLTLTFRRYSL